MRVLVSIGYCSAGGTGSCPPDEQRNTRQCMVRIPLPHMGYEITFSVRLTRYGLPNNTEGGIFYVQNR